jgi:hypothetical protein
MNMLDMVLFWKVQGLLIGWGLYCCDFVSAVALRPNAGHSLLIFEVSRSHTTTHHSR